MCMPYALCHRCRQRACPSTALEAGLERAPNVARTPNIARTGRSRLEASAPRTRSLGRLQVLGLRGDSKSGQGLLAASRAARRVLFADDSSQISAAKQQHTHFTKNPHSSINHHNHSRPRFVVTIISIMRSFLSAILSAVALSSCLAFTTPPHAASVSQARNGEASASARRAFSNPFSRPPSGGLPPPAPEDFDGDDDVGALAPVADGLTDALVLALRLSTCALMLHHGIDKMDHVDGFTANVVDKFFGFLPGPGKFWTLGAAATQIAGAGLLSVGVLARPVALSMSATMITAVTFHLLSTGAEGFPLGVPAAHSYNFELAALYVAVLSYFSAAGAGKYSVDEKILGGELQLYENLWQKVTGGSED